MAKKRWLAKIGSVVAGVRVTYALSGKGRKLMWTFGSETIEMMADSQDELVEMLGKLDSEDRRAPGAAWLRGYLGLEVPGPAPVDSLPQEAPAESVPLDPDAETDEIPTEPTKRGSWWKQ